MASSASLRENPLIQLDAILQRLTSEQRQAIKYGRAWEVIDQTKEAILASQFLDREDLAKACDTLKKKFTKEEIIDPQKLKMRAQLALGQTTEKEPPPGGVGKWIVDWIAWQVGNASITTFKWKGVSCNISAQEMGLTLESCETIKKIIPLMIRYICQHIVRYENGTRDPPGFLKKLFHKQGDKWVLGDSGKLLKYRLLTENKGQFSINIEELDSFCSLIQTNVFTILRNFKKASENKFYVQGKSFDAIQKALGPQQPSLQSLAQAITDFLLLIFLHEGANDITLPLISGLVFNKFKTELTSGVTKLLKTEDVTSLIAQVQGKEADEALDDLISDAIFPMHDALELKNLIGVLPLITPPFPGLFSLKGGPHVKKSLANISAEVAGTLISGLCEEEHLQKAIRDVQMSLRDRGIKEVSSIRLAVQSILEQKLSPLKGKTEGDGIEKFLLSLLENERAKNGITSYVEATILTLINNFCTNLAEDKVLFPESLLTQTENLDKRADLLAKFILDTTKINVIPLPFLLEPLRPLLDQFVKSPLIQSSLQRQFAPLVQQLDDLTSLEGKKKEGKKPELALPPEVERPLAKFGGSLAAVAAKKMLKQPSQEIHLPEVQRSFTSILSTMKTMLRPKHYSSSAPPPKILERFFEKEEKGYQLSAQGIFLTSLLEDPATVDCISSYLTATFSGFVDHLKATSPADLQIPKELLDCKAKEEDRAKAISTWVLGLFMKKEDLNLPPLLTPLREGVWDILSKAAEQQTRSLLPKVDAWVAKEPAQGKEEDTGIISLLKELQQPLTTLGTYIGMTYIQRSLQEIDLQTQMAPLLAQGFSEKTLLFPQKLMTEFFDVVTDELERKDPSRPPFKIFRRLLFKEDPEGVFAPNDLGKVLIPFLKDKAKREQLVRLLEANFLIILEKLCLQKIKPEQLLDSLCKVFDSIIPLLQPASTKEQKEPSYDELSSTLRPLFEKFLGSMNLVLPMAKEPASLNTALAKLLTIGMASGLKKFEENIPKILEMFLTPTSLFRELKQAAVSIGKGLEAQKKESSLSHEKISTYTQKIYQFIKALFPELRIPELVCKNIIKWFIPYLEIPISEVFKTSLQAASENDVSVKKLLEDMEAKPSAPSDVSGKVSPRKFIKEFIKAQKEHLKIKELHEKGIISWLKKKFKTIIFTILGWILPRFFRESQEKDKDMVQRIQTLMKLTENVLTTKSP